MNPMHPPGPSMLVATLRHSLGTLLNRLDHAPCEFNPLLPAQQLQ
jgi:hypothetical protein